MYLKVIPILVLIYFKTVRLETTESRVSNFVNSKNDDVLQGILGRATEHEELADGPSKLSKYTNQFESLHSELNEIRETLDKNRKQITEIKTTLDELTDVDNGSPIRKRIPRHCKEVLEKGNNVTGVYSIYPEFAPEPFLVLCDMDSRGGGWTYFLNRFNGKQDFYLDWDAYKKGFGNIATEFWLGLDHLHQLTGYEVNELLVELVDWDGKEVEAHYGLFGIGDENEGYATKLLGGYSGNAGDSFSYHAGMKFTTKDKDQDMYKMTNCAIHRSGAWWYYKCVNSHLTGKYLKGYSSDEDEYKVMHWDKFHGSKYSLKEARMMVRPRDSRSSVRNE